MHKYELSIGRNVSVFLQQYHPKSYRGYRTCSEFKGNDQQLLDHFEKTE